MEITPPQHKLWWGYYISEKETLILKDFMDSTYVSKHFNANKIPSTLNVEGSNYSSADRDRSFLN